MTSSNEFSGAGLDDAVAPGRGTVSVVVERHDAAVVLLVSGEIDLVTAPHLQAAIALALNDRPEVLVVDLTNVGLLSSAGLTVLIRAHFKAGNHTRFRVVAAGRTTFRPITLTGVDDEIAVFGTRQEALAAG